MKKWIAAGSLAGALAGCGSCIARGSRVRTPMGLRPIEFLRPGDEVVCVDPATGESVIGTITAVRSAFRECVSLGLGQAELRLTPDHPVYCPSSRTWAPAGDWALGRRGTVLQVTSEGVRAVWVERRSTFAGVSEVFDLTVDHPLHNFVAEGVLVHNKTPIRQACAFSDGGSERVHEGEDCRCPGTDNPGFAVCHPDGGAECVSCASPADAGSLDAGSDSDGGS